MNRKTFSLGLGILITFACGAKPAPQATVPYDNFSAIHLAATPSVDGTGERFAFEWCDRLWIAPVAGGTAVPVRQTDGFDRMPVFAPDGRRLAFLACGGDRTRILSVIDLESGEVTPVTRNTEATFPYGWTADGSGLVCGIVRDDEDDDRASRVAVFSLAGAPVPETLLFDATADSPALSPDGRYVLFTRWGYGVFRKYVTGRQASQIWLYDRTAHTFRALIVRDTEARQPLWAPDGRSFYYLSGTSGVLNLVHRDLETGDERPLTAFTEDSVVGYSLSGNGRIAVLQQGFDFWRLDLENPSVAPARIALKPAVAPAVPKVKRRTFTRAWNNDYEGTVTFADHGMQIAFTAGGDVWVMDTVLKEPRLVHGDATTHERECVFAADGSALYWLSDHGDRVNLVKAVRADPARPWWENRRFNETTLVNDGETRSDLKLSPDGTRLSWNDLNGRLIIADLNGRVVAKGPECIRSGAYCWSPDGAWIAQTRVDEFANSDVWIFPLDGRTEPYNLSCHFKWDGDPAWSPDGKLLAFSGNRPNGSGSEIFYVYLDPADEAHDLELAKLERSRATIRGKENGKERAKGKGEKAKAGKSRAKRGQPKVKIVFEGLRERVRRTGVPGEEVFFRHDSRTLGFANGGETKTIHIPDSLKPVKAFSRIGKTIAWLERDNRLLRSVGGVPAHGDTLFNFTAYQELDLAGYRRLGVLSAWERLNNRYYDPGHHGADMKRLRDKYVRAGEEAPTFSVYCRVMKMLIGELDSSHLNFMTTAAATKFWNPAGGGANDWRETTGHTGLRFVRGWTGEGWKVRDVLPGSPAAVNAAKPIKPGDLIVAVNGRPTGPRVELAARLNGPVGQIVELTVKSGGLTRIERIPTESYDAAREQVRVRKLAARAAEVHRRSKNRLGYLYIPVMNQASYVKFEQDLFREGYGRDGIIIDVRGNAGGSITDQLLAALCGANHGFTVYRNAVRPGYLGSRWAAPYWFKPLTVICDQNSCSNAEIFSHAIKTLKRGRLVGVATGGNVISTFNPPLLDLGCLRQCTRGWFRLDGTDMEQNGAVPDVEVAIGPDDEVAGRDPQLDAAIRTLTEDVAKFMRERKPLKPVYPRPVK